MGVCFDLFPGGLQNDIAAHVWLAHLDRVNVERIRERLKEDFSPFAVVTSSGYKYPVPHPDFLFLTSKVVIVADQRGAVVHLDPLHVVGLEDIHNTGNGKSRRTRKK